VVSDAGSSAATGSGSSLAEIAGGIRRGDGCVDCIGQTDVIRENPGPQAKIEVVATTTSKPSSLTPTMIGARVKSSYVYELRRCYARQSWTGKAASGDVTVSFEVNEAAVTKRFRASGFDRMLDRCILGLLPDWKFPKPLDPQSGKPIGGTTYTITLRFTAL
jgi:hypothetical protein